MWGIAHNLSTATYSSREFMGMTPTGKKVKQQAIVFTASQRPRLLKPGITIMRWEYSSSWA